jgi:hypothetical protein
MTGLTEFSLSRHALEEMERRQIPRAFVENVLANPEQVIHVHGGKVAYQSRIDFGAGKIFLLRVIVNESVTPAVVVTVYRTSKIEKYWGLS